MISKEKQTKFKTLYKFKVKVTDSGNVALANYPVIVKITKVFNNSMAILDIPHIYEDSGEITYMNLMVFYFIFSLIIYHLYFA